MNYNWNWGVFFETSPDGVHSYLETLLLGTGWWLAVAGPWTVAPAFLAFGLTQTSRLGCQIVMTEELDGLTVKLPQATRNMMSG